ncbi:unnamed protein product [Acanthoscelides obtectus]|uniref:HTH psq-type domain-containing protein n=1 Tax=Acanthoscelides obtectus TaxID=200917 RepID=A0A9P0JQY9_ACAOB|nr:unnamed protein product [Acanthoscelides obtectus]CAK1663698.1 PiggyBac transposable element-derived protein 2 [Acanthoscelides obtectus]
MGGSDRMDKNIGQHRIQIRNRKWYWSLFTWLLDVAVNNVWCLYRKANKSQIPQINFRRTVVQVYLKKYSLAPKGGGRLASPSSSVQAVVDDVRYDRMDHLVEKIPNDKRRRCAGNLCKSSRRTQCKRLTKIPTTYKRKNEERAKWSAGSLRNGIECVQNRTVDVNEAARQFGIPKTTLKDRIKKGDAIKQHRLDSESESPVLQESDTSADECDESECVGCGENYFKTTKNDEWLKCHTGVGIGGIAEFFKKLAARKAWWGNNSILTKVSERTTFRIINTKASTDREEHPMTSSGTRGKKKIVLDKDTKYAVCRHIFFYAYHMTMAAKTEKDGSTPEASMKDPRGFKRSRKVK